MDLLVSFVGSLQGLRVLGVVVALLGSVADPVLCADETAGKSVTPHLGLGIPSDCVAYLHTRHNDLWSSFGADMGSVLEALNRSGVIDRYLLGPGASGSAGRGDDTGKTDAEAEVRKQLAAWKEMFGSVEWAMLMEREFALGVRVVYRFDLSRIEILALFRVAPAARSRLSAQLENLLEEAAVRGDGLEMVRTRREGIPTVLVQSPRNRQAELCLGGLHDVIALSTSAKLLRRSLRLLEGVSSRPSMVIHESYGEALGVLAETSSAGRQSAVEFLARPPVYFDQISGLLAVLESSRDEESSPSLEAARKIGARLAPFRDAIDVIEWIGLVAAPAGADREIVADFAVKIKKAAAASGLHRVVDGQPPLAGLERLVPTGAASFVGWSGLDVALLWTRLAALAAAGAPGFAGSSGGWTKLRKPLADAGLGELIDGLQGTILLLTPGDGEGTSSADGAVILARLREGTNGTAIADRLREKLSGGALQISVHDGHLLLGTGSAVQLGLDALALRDGQGTSIIDAPGFRKEHFTLDGSPYAVFRLDTSTALRLPRLLRQIVGGRETDANDAVDAGWAHALLESLGVFGRIDGIVVRKDRLYRGRAVLTRRRQKKEF